MEELKDWMLRIFSLGKFEFLKNNWKNLKLHCEKNNSTIPFLGKVLPILGTKILQESRSINRNISLVVVFLKFFKDRKMFDHIWQNFTKKWKFVLRNCHIPKVVNHLLINGNRVISISYNLPKKGTSFPRT